MNFIEKSKVSENYSDAFKSKSPVPIILGKNNNVKQICNLYPNELKCVHINISSIRKMLSLVAEIAK